MEKTWLKHYPKGVPANINVEQYPSLVALIGLYLSHSIRRQQELNLAERRLAAYQPLWQLTKMARRSRSDPATP